MSTSNRTLRRVLVASLVTGTLSFSTAALAEVALNDPEKSDGWSVTLGGRVDAYLSYIFGETMNTSGLGNEVPDPYNPGQVLPTRYRLIGPQIEIRGNPTADGAVHDNINDTDLHAFRVRGGFASTQLQFNLYKQLYPDLKLSVRVGFWAGIENSQEAGYRPKNQARPVDVREQYFVLSGSWGSAWGGRTLGLFNRGGMRMDWYLMHQQGVGHPCNVDSGGPATCGHTGVGSMFPNRNAQIGYATPEIAGVQLSVAMFDPDNIDQDWNRAPYPRFESELTYKKDFGGGDELNVWANGLWQVIGRTREKAPVPPSDPRGLPPGTQFPNGNEGVPANRELNVLGAGGGAWARFFGFALGGTGWIGQGLGTATPLGSVCNGDLICNTAIDTRGTMRTHYGYLFLANYRIEDLELAAGYGEAHAVETDWDKDPINPDKYSVIRQVRGISGKIAYYLHPSLVVSVDGMNVHYAWWRGEKQTANVVSLGAVALW